MVTDVKRADFCFVQSSLECHVFLVLVLASVWPRGSVTMVMMMMIGHHHKVGHDLFNYTGCLSLKIFKKKQDLITTTIIWPQVCVCVYTPVVLDSFWKFSKSNCYGNFWSRIVDDNYLLTLTILLLRSTVGLWTTSPPPPLWSRVIWLLEIFYSIFIQWKWMAKMAGWICDQSQMHATLVMGTFFYSQRWQPDRCYPKRKVFSLDFLDFNDSYIADLLHH